MIGFGQNQKIIGDWNNSSKDAIITIYEDENGLICGKIAWMKYPNDALGNPKTDPNNPDVNLRSRTRLGMKIMSGFINTKNNFWDKGSLYDPKKGKIYSGMITFKDEDRIELRGYFGVSFMGRSSVWTRNLDGKPKSKNPYSRTKNDSWKGNGSGFFISKSGYIVTNNHVIDGASEIEVEFKYKNEIESFNAKVIKVDKTNDLAIIKIDDDKFKNLSVIPYNFKTRTIDTGSEVFALGYPLALSIMGKDIKFTNGRISSKTGIDGDITTYQISVPIQPGNSGGPLFDFNGNLIGITSSTINRKLNLTENVNYAIKSSYLLNLIDVLPETISLPSSTQLASKLLTEQIKILSDYVVLIKVK
jgi:S1-C subfamily serine protease